MRRLPVTALAGLIAGLALPAAAQQAIPDTIVSATRVPTPQERVPAATTIITRQEIEERGYQSLAEALTAVPGLRLSGGLGGQTSAFLRGAGSRNTLVLLDGVPVNDPAEANGAFNFGNELLFDVERIEVLRGPASTPYGSAAIGGVVNIVTRRAPADRAFAPYGELAGGTQRTLRGGAGVAGTVGAVDYLLSGQSLTTRGFDILPPRMTTRTGERDGFSGQAATARLGWTPAEGTRIEGLLRWRENRFGFDNDRLSDGIRTDDPNAGGHDRRILGQIRGETALLDGAWSTGLRIARTEDRRRYLNQPDSITPDESSRDFYLGTRTSLDWGNTLLLPGFGAFADGTLGFGIAHSLEESQQRSTSTSVFGESFTRVDATQHMTGGYATLQYRAFGRLDLTAGLRHDSITGNAEATTWRLGAVLALPEIASRLRISGGTAFQAPALFQRFGVTPFFRGNPDLKPERSIGWEIGAETDLPAFGRANAASFGWTYFQSRVTDLINFDSSFTTLVNVDRADIHGAELGLTLRPAAWAEATVAWTITEAMNAATGQRLARRPEHVVSVTARLEPLPRLVVAPTLLFTGRAVDYIYADDGSNPAGRSTPAGTVVNLTATWQAFDQAALFLEARNLGNSRFEPQNGFVTPGRSVLLGTRFAL
jgi:vitamin B12 transporter